MRTDGYYFYEGDLVCYSQRHYDWMVKAARWPSKFIPRTAFRGTVVSCTADAVRVTWNHDTEPLTHFPDSLELLVSHSYEEEP